MTTSTDLPKPSKARLVFRLLAAFCLLFSLVYWVNKGAHTGWNMDRVPIPQIDEITGIEYVTYEDRFVPGIEWLGGGIGLGVLLFVTSFFFRSKPAHSNP
ncbi:MAG: hypothetical protein H7A44_05785 [Opitutaceae bacterium]|nr:hypothetical protein [Cephaloticoccus sp.]MCP5529934.1 hypothetical protein [Opitutaceae bacterium]